MGHVCLLQWKVVINGGLKTKGGPGRSQLDVGLKACFNGIKITDGLFLLFAIFPTVFFFFN